MGRLGKVRTFQISRPLLLWAGLFFAAFVIFSIVAINGYLRLKEENLTLLDKMEFLEVDLEKGRKAFEESQKRISFLEEYVRGAEERTEKVPQAGSAPLQGKHPDVAAGTPPSDKSPGEWIQLKDILLVKEGAKLSVSFRLANTQPGDHPMKGYVHIIAENNQSDPPRFWAYPQQNLVKGVPENFRTGHAFSIARYIMIKGKIELGSGSPHPLSVKVLIYDREGTVIKESAFEVPQESRQIGDPKAFVPHSGSTLKTSFHGSHFFTFTRII